MQVIRSIKELLPTIADLRAKQKTIGFVPTMGYLHEGHASLIKRASAENEVTVVSIFLNPLQFGPNEDLDRYPRDEERDLRLAEACGASIVFLPQVSDMYPQGFHTTIRIAKLTDKLCGASRPGHFDGVGTVVGKLFHLVQPTHAYFGMKDAQQVAIIKQMVMDLHFPLEIVPCPIMREADGLALSSRNVFLSDDYRKQALVLSQALQLAQKLSQQEDTTPASLIASVRAKIGQAAAADIDYVELVSYPSLEDPESDKGVQDLEGEYLLALAVRFGSTRLIDNCVLNFKGGA